MNIGYKVVTKDLKSLGLRKNPTIMTFTPYAWVEQPLPVEGKVDHGGIWFARTKAGAKALSKYMKNKHGVETRVFEVEYGEVLYGNSYRIKTNRVRLRGEIL